MSTIAPIANLIWDNADADGRIELHGGGYDWVFKPLRQDGALDPDNFEPVWWLDGCEIIPGLNVLGLSSSLLPINLALADWTVSPTSGHWRIEKPDDYPRVNWLSYVDTAVGQTGTAQLVGGMAPFAPLRFIEFGPPPDQTGNVFTSVEFLGIPNDEHPTGVNYKLLLPWASRTYKFPLLYHDLGQTGTYTLADTCERVDLAEGAATGGVLRRNVLLRWLPIGVLYINIGGSAEPWLYIPPYGPPATTPEDPDALYPQWSHLKVTFSGHAGMFNLGEAWHPTSGTAKPLQYRIWPTWMNPEPDEVLSCLGGMGGDIIDEMFVDVSWADRPDTYTMRPVITLTRGEEANQTPLLHVVHERHNATSSAARSSPVTTQVRADVAELNLANPCELQGVRWNRKLYRGWECQALIVDHSDYWSAYLQPNMKVKVQAAWLGEALSDIMVGYLGDPAYLKEPETDQGLHPILQLRGRDYIMGRLADKKFVRWSNSPESWDVDHWVSQMLMNAGYFGTFTCPADIHVAPSFFKDLQFAFSEDTPVLKAIDTVLLAHGLSPLGVTTAGTLWSSDVGRGTGYVYTTPDFTLNEATATGDDFIAEVDNEVDDSAFRNATMAFSGVWGEPAIDFESYKTPGHDLFIGDDWWEVEVANDTSNLALRAAQMLRERRRARRKLRWTRLLKPDLRPGMFVAVTVGDLGVPAGTVMQIVEESGEVRAGVMDARSEFVCEDWTWQNL